MSKSSYPLEDLTVSPFYKIEAYHSKDTDGAEYVCIRGLLPVKYETKSVEFRVREYQYLFTIPVRKKPQDIVEFAKKQLINICTTEVKPTVKQFPDYPTKVDSMIEEGPLSEKEADKLIDSCYTYTPEIKYTKVANLKPVMHSLNGQGFTYSALEVLPPLE